jgi:HSP20 family molecular chaperone IbpA
MLTVRGEKRTEREEQDKDKNWRVMECSYGSFSRTIPLPFGPANRSRPIQNNSGPSIGLAG